MFEEKNLVKTQVAVEGLQKLVKSYVLRATNYTCCKNCTPRNRLLQRQDLEEDSGCTKLQT